MSKFSIGDRVVYHNNHGGLDEFNDRTGTVRDAYGGSTVRIKWDINNRSWDCNIENVKLLPTTPTTHSNWSQP